MDNEPLDPQLVTLAKAIRQKESGGSPTRRGSSGEYGAYQFMPSTWAEKSRLAGVNVPLEHATMEQQNEVAYKTLQTWKQQHPDWNVGNFASAWNAGEGEPNAYTGSFSTGHPARGTNEHGVAYDVPGYASDVADYYQQFKGQPTAADVPAPAAQFGGGDGEQSQGILPNVNTIGTELGTNVAGRFQKGSEAVTTALEGLSQGDLSKGASGALQTVGQVAGGIGDVANAVFELIPGVQMAEHGLTKGLGAFSQTPTGQKIFSSLATFAEQHPQIAGDIGAAINIASVVPMFKGLGLVKGAVQDAALAPIKGRLLKAADTELRGALPKKAVEKLSATEARGLKPVDYITNDTQTIPKVVDNPKGGYMYDSTDAATHVQTGLAEDEAALQKLLTSATKKEMINVEQAKAQMIKDMLREFPASTKGGIGIKAVHQFFDNLEPTLAGRGWIGVEELNNLKREVGGGVNWFNLGVKNGEVKSAMYRSFMTQVEKAAKKSGIKGVKELNHIMAGKIEAINVLKALQGAKVNQSPFGKFIREFGQDVAGVGGEALGRTANVPYSSAIAGRGIARLIPGLRKPLSPTRFLGKDGRGSPASSVVKGVLQVGVPQAIRPGTGQSQQ